MDDNYFSFIYFVSNLSDHFLKNKISNYLFFSLNKTRHKWISAYNFQSPLLWNNCSHPKVSYSCVYTDTYSISYFPLSLILQQFSIFFSKLGKTKSSTLCLIFSHSKNFIFLSVWEIFWLVNSSHFRNFNICTVVRETESHFLGRRNSTHKPYRRTN